MSRTTLTPEETASYARVLTPFLSQAKSVSTIVNPKVLPTVTAPQTKFWLSSCVVSNHKHVVQEDLVLLRLTTKKNELMVVPGTTCEGTHARTHALTSCSTRRTKVHDGCSQDSGLQRRVRHMCSLHKAHVLVPDHAVSAVVVLRCEAVQRGR